MERCRSLRHSLVYLNRRSSPNTRCFDALSYFAQVPEVFYYAEKAMLNPIAPLSGQEAQSLKRRIGEAAEAFTIEDKMEVGLQPTGMPCTSMMLRAAACCLLAIVLEII
uniref:Uncharacterized protein n=1 Tax=Oryza nivara TaxID=4536 RepID=A0A0E0I0X7_ORYNI